MLFLKERRFGRTKRCLAAVVLFAFILTANVVSMAESEEANGVLRSRAYKFRYITSQQAQELFSQLKIGSSFDVLSDEVLIVTSNKGADLIKATEVIGVLDQKDPGQIRVLMVGTKQNPLPEIEPFIAGLKTITVGTMTDAPPKGTAVPAIIGVLDDKLIAIASETVLVEIEKAFDVWRQTLAKPSSRPAVADETVDQESQTVIQQEVAVQEIEQEKSLEKVMAELLDKEEQVQAEAAMQEQEVVSEPSAEEDLLTMLQGEPNTTEDYIGDELLKSLLDEERRAQPSVAVPQGDPSTAIEKAVEQAEAATIPRPKTTVETHAPQQPVAEEDPLKKVMEMLSKSSSQPEQEQTLSAEETRPSESVSENLKLQREMAILRQQVAELQAQKTASEETPTEPQKVEPEEEPQTEAKIVTDGRTEFEKAIGHIGDEMLETIIDVPQEVELDWLVDLVGKQLGLNYMYDPAILKNQKVTLKIHKGQIKVKDLYALLESVLRFRGFIMTRRGDLVTIMRAADIAKIDTTLVNPDDPVQPGDIIVSSVFQLNSIDPTTAQNLLKGLNLGTDFDVVESTNTLIVTDYAYRMDQIRQVLEMVDVPGDAKEFKFRQLQYMQAADLVAKLKELVAQMEGVSMQVGTPTPATAAPKTRPVTTRDPRTGRTVTKQVPVNTAQPAAAAAKKDAVFVDTDERTNRILMIGTAEQIDIINQLIDTLDVRQFDLKYVKEYIIQYVEAIEVVNVLNELGLTDLNVSTGGSKGTSAAQTAVARRTAAARGAQPPQPAAPAAPNASTVSGGADQPNISIRPATNSLLVNGTEEQHGAIELVIAHVDVIQKDQRTIREYEIQYVDTQEIIDTMTDLGLISPQNVSGSSSSRDTSSQATRRSGRSTQQQATPEAVAATPGLLGGFGGEESGEGGDVTEQQPQIAVLEATNSLLVYATPRQHNAIALLIAHADRVPETTTTPYVVYALENQDPLELAEVLSKLIQETVEEVGKKSAPDAKIQTAGAATGGGGVASIMEEQKIRVIPDVMSYSLIVYANKRNQQWISELIKELDKYHPQVLLDCTLVEITKDNEFTMDLDIVGKIPEMTPGGAMSVLTKSDTAGVSGLLEPFPSTRITEYGITNGSGVAFYADKDVQALLKLMDRKGYGRVLARPSLLVKDNQEGEIKSEKTIFVGQEKTVITPTTDTSTSTSTDITFADYTSGITLTITPHIASEDLLKLDILLDRTDFDPTDTGKATIGTKTVPKPLNTISSNVATSAIIPNGATIILGGIETINQTKSVTKIPLLGDIPLLGALFRGIDESDVQSKLYVFVKANILRPEDELTGESDIEKISLRRRGVFESAEKKFQEVDGVPGIKPNPISPEKMLEDDEYLEKIKKKLEEIDKEKTTVEIEIQ